MDGEHWSDGDGDNGSDGDDDDDNDGGAADASIVFTEKIPGKKSYWDDVQLPTPNGSKNWRRHPVENTKRMSLRENHPF